MSDGFDMEAQQPRTGGIWQILVALVAVGAFAWAAFLFFGPWAEVAIAAALVFGVVDGVAARLRNRTRSDLPPLPPRPEKPEASASNAPAWRPTGRQVMLAFVLAWLIISGGLVLLTDTPIWSATANGFALVMLGLPLGLALLIFAGAAVLVTLTVVYETVLGGITSLAHLVIAAYPFEPHRRAAHDRVDMFRRRLVIDRYDEAAR